jgi:hypothetical protein
MQETMSQGEYARHRNVTSARIAALLRDGVLRLIERGGARVLDVRECDAILDERKAGQARMPLPGQAAPSNIAGLARARTATEVYNARLRQLEYELKIGQVVKAEDLVRSMEHCAEMVVRHLDRIPVQAEEYAAAFTAGGLPALRTALKNAVREVRKTLADNMRMHAADGTQLAAEDDEFAA